MILALLVMSTNRMHIVELSNEYPRSLEISSDGTKMYIGQTSSDDTIYQFTLSTPFAVSTSSSYASQVFILVIQKTQYRI